MKEIIIIRGPLGVGKSTVARSLAQTLQGNYISIDTVLEELGLDTVEGESIPAKNFIAASEHVLPQIKKCLKDDTDVIVDGNFYHREQIDHLTADLPHAIFTLKAPIDVCIERDRNREKPYGGDSVRAVHSLVSRFDAGTVIDTEDKNLKEVTDEIKTFLMDTNS